MISSKVSVHTPLLIVQRRRAKSPAGTPVTVVVGDDGFVIVTLAAPSSTVQVPDPTVGVFAFSTNMPLLHCSISKLPASANVGSAWLVSATSSKLAVQVPLVIVQRRTAVTPAGTPETSLFGLEGSAIKTVGPPDITDQVPVPITGVLPSNVKFPSSQFS